MTQRATVTTYNEVFLAPQKRACSLYSGPFQASIYFPSSTATSGWLHNNLNMHFMIKYFATSTNHGTSTSPYFSTWNSITHQMKHDPRRLIALRLFAKTGKLQYANSTFPKLYKNWPGSKPELFCFFVQLSATTTSSM